MKSAIYVAIFALAAACGNSNKAVKHKQLQPYLNDYNNMMRWERPDKATPYVYPPVYPDFKQWAKDTVEKYDFQEWSTEAITYETETTATVLIERRGYEVPKYVEKKFSVVQTWIYIKDMGWRITAGF